MRASGGRSFCRWRSGESVWRANAATRANHASDSESSNTASTSRARCRGFRPGQRRAHISGKSRGWFYDKFKCREEFWLRGTRTPRNAWWTADQGIDGVPGSLKPVYAPSDDSAFVLRPSREYSLLEQDAEKIRQPVLFIWSIRSVWFVWLHETNQMDQTDQITRQTGLAQTFGPSKISRAIIVFPHLAWEALLAE
jgi:hypothetical protein